MDPDSVRPNIRNDGATESVSGGAVSSARSTVIIRSVGWEGLAGRAWMLSELG